MPHAEIADIMRCSEGTVRSRLFYARKQLQAELAEFVK
jgi:RNA polymerase sigma-70 factor (ECF subfamily)